MMAVLRSWLFSVIVTAFLLSVAEKIVPKGSLRKIMSVTGGVILMLVLLRPLTDWKTEHINLTYESYDTEIESQQRLLQEANDQSFATAVADRTEAYIVERAASMGIACHVSVETKVQENGIPVPWSAAMDCSASPELIAMLEQELNIPEERQVYDGTA